MLCAAGHSSLRGLSPRMPAGRILPERHSRMPFCRHSAVTSPQYVGTCVRMRVVAHVCMQAHGSATTSLPGSAAHWDEDTSQGWVAGEGRGRTKWMTSTAWPGDSEYSHFPSWATVFSSVNPRVSRLAEVPSRKGSFPAHCARVPRSAS